MSLMKMVVIRIMPSPFYSRFPFHNYYRSPRSTTPSLPIVEATYRNSSISSDDQTNHQQSNERSSSKEEALFEIFGLELFYDDILLICLIFFLYSEGVKDEMLFISLILLLLS